MRTENADYYPTTAGRRAHTPELDSIIPTDFLSAGLWDRQRRQTDFLSNLSNGLPKVFGRIRSKNVNIFLN